METVVEDELCFPLLINTSCQKYKLPNAEIKLIYSVLFCISLLTVVLNLLVVISISHFRQLHTPTNLLLLSLAVCDCLVGLIVMPIQIILIEPCWLLDELVCLLYYFVPFITVYASVVNMVMISIDRYVAICDPLRYTTKFTQRKVKVSVLLCWIYSVFYSLISLNRLRQPGRYNSCDGECVIKIIRAADLVLGFLIPISAIIILYVRVFVVVVSQVRSMRSHVAAVKLQRSLTVTVQRSELKAARTLGVVVAVFLMCYCPYYVMYFSGHNIEINPSTKLFFVFLVYFNSCINPVIYAFFYPWFRKCVKLIFMLHILQPHSCQSSVL